MGVLAVLVCTVVATRPAAAQGAVQIIEQIRVEGNQRIEAETVRSYLEQGGVIVGGRMDREIIDRGFKELFATSLFADINLRREGGTLVVSVVENPIINRLAFEGNKRISDEILEAEVQLRPRIVFTRGKVKSDVARILEIYRRSGRFATTADAKVIQQAQNRVDLVFEIEEGPLTSIRKISFIGNRRISDGVLKRRIRSREDRWYCFTCFLSGDGTYDPDRLTFDRELLRRHYRSKGYAEFRVTSVVAELTRDRGGFFVTFALEEGERYRFGAIRVENSIRGLDPEGFLGNIETQSGEIYDDIKIEDSILKLTNKIGGAGFAFVNVERKEDRNRDSQTIDITYRIDEGDRKYVERINITGNVRTRDEVIRRELRLVEGDAFNAAKLRRSGQRLRNLGFFEKVDLATVAGSSPDKLIIDFDVSERRTGEISIGAGYSSFAGPLADFALTERNFLGRGQRLGMAFRISGQQRLLDLSFDEPYFLGRDLRAGFRVYGSQTDVTGEDDFDQTSIGFDVRMGYPLADRLRHTVSYGINRTDIGDISPGTSPFIAKEAGATLTSFVTQSLRYSTLNSRIDPSEGYSVSLSQKFAGVGGDVNYVKHRLSASYYRPVTETWVGSLKASVGHVFSFGGDEVSISDRYVTSERDLRGFESGGIGPRDACTDDALRGNIVATGSAELSFPLGLPELFNFRGRLFADVGTLYEIDQADPGVTAIAVINPADDEPYEAGDTVAFGASEPCAGFIVGSPRLIDESSLRASAGVGVSFVSPIGPMRFDYGWPIVKEGFDKEKQFTFTFGTRF